MIVQPLSHSFINYLPQGQLVAPFMYLFFKRRLYLNDLEANILIYILFFFLALVTILSPFINERRLNLSYLLVYKYNSIISNKDNIFAISHFKIQNADIFREWITYVVMLVKPFYNLLPLSFRFPYPFLL